MNAYGDTHAIFNQSNGIELTLVSPNPCRPEPASADFLYPANRRNPREIHLGRSKVSELGDTHPLLILEAPDELNSDLLWYGQSVSVCELPSFSNQVLLFDKTQSSGNERMHCVTHKLQLPWL